MRTLALLAGLAWLGSVFASVSFADDEDVIQIKQAIVADSAIMHRDFERLGTANAPSASKVEDKSLTLILLGLKVDEAKMQEGFRFLTDQYPKPAELAKELYRERRTGKRRILLEPVTFIHLDRITDFTCEVHADRATGTVSFKVPELYQGEVDFVAQRVDGKWFIMEFMMPTHRIHLVRANDGQWKEK